MAGNQTATPPQGTPRLTSGQQASAGLAKTKGDIKSYMQARGAKPIASMGKSTMKPTPPKQTPATQAGSAGNMSKGRGMVGKPGVKPPQHGGPIRPGSGPQRPGVAGPKNPGIGAATTAGRIGAFTTAFGKGKPSPGTGPRPGTGTGQGGNTNGPPPVSDGNPALGVAQTAKPPQGKPTIGNGIGGVKSSFGTAPGNRPPVNNSNPGLANQLQTLANKNTVARMMGKAPVAMKPPVAGPVSTGMANAPVPKVAPPAGPTATAAAAPTPTPSTPAPKNITGAGTGNALSTGSRMPAQVK